jgi:hypothetical protein
MFFAKTTRTNENPPLMHTHMHFEEALHLRRGFARLPRLVLVS